MTAPIVVSAGSGVQEFNPYTRGVESFYAPPPTIYYKEGGVASIMNKLLTRQEAAQMLGITVSTLDIIRKAGNIEYIQYTENGRVFFTENGLQQFIIKSTHYAIHRPASSPTFRKRRRAYIPNKGE